MNRCHQLIIFICILFSIATFSVRSQEIAITIDDPTAEHQVGAVIGIEATLEDYIPDAPNYLHSWVDATGFRKLKLGNNPYNIYNPPLDAIADGHTELVITLRVRDDLTKWKKMQIRPNGISNSIILSDYIPATIQTNEWFQISIPMGDFDQTIDFTQLKTIEFPYSAAANHYDWDIYSIIFIGGSQPVTWMGPGNIQNAHNGNGGPGEVFAQWNLNLVDGKEILPELRLLVDGQLIEKASGFSHSFEWQATAAGEYQLEVQAYDGTRWITNSFASIQISEPVTPDIGITLTAPADQAELVYEESFRVETEVSHLDIGSALLRVKGFEEGWRKLKIGNNPDNLYSPAIDVTRSGNTLLEIIVKDPEATVDWTKIDLRPNGLTTNPLEINEYWDQREILSDNWAKITIPLSAFDAGVDFTQIGHIEFPYSRGAGVFTLDIREMTFTGGTAPYIWFGPEKRDVIHDGFGLAGQLLAEWIIPESQNYTAISADLLIDSEHYASDTEFPFAWEISELAPGGHSLQAILNLDETSIPGNVIQVEISDPTPPDTKIVVHHSYPIANIPVGKSFPITGEIEHLAAGVSVQSSLLVNGVEQASSESSPFNFLVSFPDPGRQEWSIQAITSEGLHIESDTHIIEATEPLRDQHLILTAPVEGDSYYLDTPIDLQASYHPDTSGETAYLAISNPGSGYRKLKLGNNPDNLYSPQINLLGSGNTQLEIIIQLLDGDPDLSKLIICPQEVTTGAPKLSTYWDQAEELADGWKKLTIPLSDFDPSVDFTAIGYIAFPYSRDAGRFTLGIKEIRFSGAEDILYFGPSKLDNIHDGDGGSGQLTAQLVIDHAADVPTQYLFFAQNEYCGSLTQVSDTSQFIAQTTGNYRFELYGQMPDGQLYAGSSANVNIIEPYTNEDAIQIKITLHQPESIAIQKARLRYNKSFAYSLTLDDGLADAYDHAYQILNGGYIAENGENYPGLFFTDGCGNDVPFAAGIAWFSVSSNYNDLHTNTPGYIYWSELIDLFNSGWDILNHSYSHSIAETTDYYQEIALNQQKVLDQTGIEMSQFVIPGGGDYLAYQQAAQAYGMHAIYAYKSDFEGYPKGIITDEPRDWKGISLYRAYKYDSYYTSANIMDALNGVAASATPTLHPWYNDFTHRVHFTEIGGSLRVETFAHYMETIESLYGKHGTDQVWMAPLQQVWEYLYIRDHTNIVTERNENEILVTIDTREIPESLRTKAMSLLAESTAGFQVESLTPGVTVAYNDATGLINLAWDKKTAQLKSQPFASGGSSSKFDLQVFPNPVSEYLTIVVLSEEKTTRIRLLDQTGRLVLQRNMTDDTSRKLLTIHRSEISLPGGVYYVLVTSGNRVQVEKVVLL